MSRSDQEHPDPHDPFGPPAVPTLVHCIHCNHEYESYLIKWVVTPDRNGKPWGHWACPIPGCDGAGFCFDILPVDPDWRDEHGERVWCDDDEDEDDDEFVDGIVGEVGDDDDDDDPLPFD
jgi:hypothetical protein